MPHRNGHNVNTAGSTDREEVRSSSIESSIDPTIGPVYRESTINPVSTAFNPFPDPTSSLPLWHHARSALGNPSYFHEMMRLHFPWDTQHPSAFNPATEFQQQPEVDLPFAVRNHDSIIEIEQMLADFRRLLVGCEHWEDGKALEALRSALRLAKWQMEMGRWEERVVQPVGKYVVWA